jgi:predicted nuclease with RNAse H fold
MQGEPPPHRVADQNRWRRLLSRRFAKLSREFLKATVGIIEITPQVNGMNLMSFDLHPLCEIIPVSGKSYCSVEAP